MMAYGDIMSGTHLTPTPVTTEQAAARVVGYRHARKDQSPDDCATLMARLERLLT